MKQHLSPNNYLYLILIPKSSNYYHLNSNTVSKWVKTKHGVPERLILALDAYGILLCGLVFKSCSSIDLLLTTTITFVFILKFINCDRKLIIGSVINNTTFLTYFS
jgi:hypothetical protein